MISAYALLLRYNSMTTPTTGFRLGEHHKRLIAELAKRLGTSATAVVRQAVQLLAEARGVK